MTEKKPYYITTPIYYPSANLHVGHCYTTCIADALSRNKRLRGYDVFFLTGTDEHGQKIEKKAAEANVTPKEYVDDIVANAKDLWASLKISYDKFIRTTDPEHVLGVQKIFNKLYEQGDIYKGKYEGWYCTPCESFWTEAQLKDGKCPDCGRDVNWTTEDAYFLKLSKYQSAFEAYLDKHRDLMQPQSRYNEMVNNFLKPGLKDLCVSRSSVKWGIPLTFDSNQTVYVWLDALSNYITALGYLSEDDEKFKKYWPADLHLVGKEIFRFHTLIWTIMLIALGLPLPKKVYGHGWLTIGGGKISKSKGNSKDPRIFIKDYGVDTVRYFVLSEVPFGADGNFSEELMLERRNSDLANVLGNLVKRSISMANKYFGGELHKFDNYTSLDEEVVAYLNAMDKEAEDSMEELDLPKTLSLIFARLSRLNKYIDENEPWVLAKDESKKERLNDVLYTLMEGIRLCASELEPFIPDTAHKIYEQLGVPAQSLEDRYFGRYDSYKVVENPETLFERIDESVLNALKEEEKKLEESLIENEAHKAQFKHKDNIAFDSFEALEMRVGKVLSCEKHPKADKLLVLKLSFGDQERTIVSGLAEFYKPDELVGKNLVAILNLEPRKLRGIESQGLILTTEYIDEDGKEKVEVLTSSLKEGATVR